MKAVKPNWKGENKGHYSPGMIAGNLLFISGQLSIDPDTRTVPPSDFSRHMKLALRNMEQVLEEAGLSRSSVVQLRVYITDMENWCQANTECAEFFGEHKPARIIVQVPSLHFGCLTEIEAVAEFGE